jgi:hypothetical protein
MTKSQITMILILIQVPLKKEMKLPKIFQLRKSLLLTIVIHE